MTAKSVSVYTVYPFTFISSQDMTAKFVSVYTVYLVYPFIFNTVLMPLATIIISVYLVYPFTRHNTLPLNIAHTLAILTSLFPLFTLFTLKLSILNKWLQE